MPLCSRLIKAPGKFFRWAAIVPSLLALSLSFSSAGRATDGPGENPVQLRFAAIDAILHGNNKDALDLYETAIQEAAQRYGPTSSFLADLNYEAGTVALDTSQFPMAEHYLTTAVKINPYLTMAKIKLAELYRLQGKPQEASKQFRQAVQINQSSPVTRQAYIRWLATNGTSAQENAIATQEALKLAMLNASSREMFNKPMEKGRAGKNAPVLAPALVAPNSGASNAASSPPSSAGASSEKIFGQESGGTTSSANAKVEVKDKPPMSLFPFKNVKKDNQDEAEKKRKLIEAQKEAQKEAEKETAREAALKIEAARKAARAAGTSKDKAEREKAARERSARERAEREQAERERAAQKARRAAKAAVKDTAPEKAKEEPTEKVETKKAEPKPVKKAEPKPEKAPEQPALVPSAPQTYQPQFQPMMYPVPIMPQSKPKAKGPRTMVPPPPPTMPMYPGQMMRPMQAYPPPQQPAPQPKPKSTPKPAKAEPKEQPEDKPPPMTNSSDNEPEFILDWGDVKPKSKKGK